MRKAKEVNMYKAYQVGSNKVEISLLQFAYDTIFLGEADMENVKTIKAVLRSFELASGLKINFAKSTFGAFGQTDLWKQQAATYLNCQLLELLRDRLPTRKNLQRRQIQLTDSLCPLCITQQEDASHLFFHCSKVQPIWWETMSWVQVKGAFPLSPQQHFLHHLGVQPAGSIWKLRNSIVFSNANFDANKLFEEAIFLLWSWLRVFEKDFTVHFNHWSSNLPQTTTIWVFRHCRGFCGFQRGQCGFSGSVGGSVASTDDNVGVEGAVSDRFQAGGEKGAISGRRMTKRRGRARFSSARLMKSQFFFNL
ncbi:hypothetical protein GmHk_02G004433 [Glycine max]|nr:hypothetical protein GmHk_02G004433 [Glycine max]